MWLIDKIKKIGQKLFSSDIENATDVALSAWQGSMVQEASNEAISAAQETVQQVQPKQQSQVDPVSTAFEAVAPIQVVEPLQVNPVDVAFNAVQPIETTVKPIDISIAPTVWAWTNIDQVASPTIIPWSVSEDYKTFLNASPLTSIEAYDAAMNAFENTDKVGFIPWVQTSDNILKETVLQPLETAIKENANALREKETDTWQEEALNTIWAAAADITSNIVFWSAKFVTDLWTYISPFSDTNYQEEYDKWIKELDYIKLTKWANSQEYKEWALKLSLNNPIAWMYSEAPDALSAVWLLATRWVWSVVKFLPSIARKWVQLAWWLFTINAPSSVGIVNWLMNKNDVEWPEWMDKQTRLVASSVLSMPSLSDDNISYLKKVLKDYTDEEIVDWNQDRIYADIFWDKWKSAVFSFIQASNEPLFTTEKVIKSDFNQTTNTWKTWEAKQDEAVYYSTEYFNPKWFTPLLRENVNDFILTQANATVEQKALLSVIQHRYEMSQRDLRNQIANTEALNKWVSTEDIIAWRSAYEKTAKEYEKLYWLIGKEILAWKSWDDIKQIVKDKKLSISDLDWELDTIYANGIVDNSTLVKGIVSTKRVFNNMTINELDAHLSDSSSIFYYKNNYQKNAYNAVQWYVIEQIAWRVSSLNKLKIGRVAWELLDATIEWWVSSGLGTVLWETIASDAPVTGKNLFLNFLTDTVWEFTLGILWSRWPNNIEWYSQWYKVNEDEYVPKKLSWTWPALPPWWDTPSKTKSVVESIVAVNSTPVIIEEILNSVDDYANNKASTVITEAWQKKLVANDYNPAVLDTTDFVPEYKEVLKSSLEQVKIEWQPIRNIVADPALFTKIDNDIINKAIPDHQVESYVRAQIAQRTFMGQPIGGNLIADYVLPAWNTLQERIEKSSSPKSFLALRQSFSWTDEEFLKITIPDNKKNLQAMISSFNIDQLHKTGRFISSYRRYDWVKVQSKFINPSKGTKWFELISNLSKRLDKINDATNLTSWDWFMSIDWVTYQFKVLRSWYSATRWNVTAWWDITVDSRNQSTRLLVYSWTIPELVVDQELSEEFWRMNYIKRWMTPYLRLNDINKNHFIVTVTEVLDKDGNITWLFVDSDNIVNGERTTMIKDLSTLRISDDKWLVLFDKVDSYFTNYSDDNFEFIAWDKNKTYDWIKYAFTNRFLDWSEEWIKLRDILFDRVIPEIFTWEDKDLFWFAVAVWWYVAQLNKRDQANLVNSNLLLNVVNFIFWDPQLWYLVDNVVDTEQYKKIVGYLKVRDDLVKSPIKFVDKLLTNEDNQKLFWDIFNDLAWKRLLGRWDAQIIKSQYNKLVWSRKMALAILNFKLQWMWKASIKLNNFFKDTKSTRTKILADGIYTWSKEFYKNLKEVPKTFEWYTDAYIKTLYKRWYQLSEPEITSLWQFVTLLKETWADINLLFQIPNDDDIIDSIKEITSSSKPLDFVKWASTKKGIFINPWMITSWVIRNLMWEDTDITSTFIEETVHQLFRHNIIKSNNTELNRALDFLWTADSIYANSAWYEIAKQEAIANLFLLLVNKRIDVSKWLETYNKFIDSIKFKSYNTENLSTNTYEWVYKYLQGEWVIKLKWVDRIWIVWFKDKGAYKKENKDKYKIKLPLRHIYSSNPLDYDTLFLEWVEDANDWIYVDKWYNVEIGNDGFVYLSSNNIKQLNKINGDMLWNSNIIYNDFWVTQNQKKILLALNNYGDYNTKQFTEDNFNAILKSLKTEEWMKRFINLFNTTHKSNIPQSFAKPLSELNDKTITSLFAIKWSALWLYNNMTKALDKIIVSQWEELWVTNINDIIRPKSDSNSALFNLSLIIGWAWWYEWYTYAQKMLWFLENSELNTRDIDINNIKSKKIERQLVVLWWLWLWLRNKKWVIWLVNKYIDNQWLNELYDTNANDIPLRVWKRWDSLWSSNPYWDIDNWVKELLREKIRWTSSWSSKEYISDTSVDNEDSIYTLIKNKVSGNNEDILIWLWYKVLEMLENAKWYYQYSDVDWYSTDNLTTYRFLNKSSISTKVTTSNIMLSDDYNWNLLSDLRMLRDVSPDSFNNIITKYVPINYTNNDNFESRVRSYQEKIKEIQKWYTDMQIISRWIRWLNIPMVLSKDVAFETTWDKADYQWATLWSNEIFQALTWAGKEYHRADIDVNAVTRRDWKFFRDQEQWMRTIWAFLFKKEWDKYFPINKKDKKPDSWYILKSYIKKEDIDSKLEYWSTNGYTWSKMTKIMYAPTTWYIQLPILIDNFDINRQDVLYKHINILNNNLESSDINVNDIDNESLYSLLKTSIDEFNQKYNRTLWSLSLFWARDVASKAQLESKEILERAITIFDRLEDNEYSDEWTVKEIEKEFKAEVNKLNLLWRDANKKYEDWVSSGKTDKELSLELNRINSLYSLILIKREKWIDIKWNKYDFSIWVNPSWSLYIEYNNDRWEYDQIDFTDSIVELTNEVKDNLLLFTEASSNLVDFVNSIEDINNKKEKIINKYELSNDKKWLDRELDILNDIEKWLSDNLEKLGIVNKPNVSYWVSDIWWIQIQYVDGITTKQWTKWAWSYNNKENIIKIDRNLLQKKYKEKAWTKPRSLTEMLRGQNITSYAKALPEDQFKSYEEREEFVIQHEYQHSLYKRSAFDKEFPEWTLWDYETIINNRAIDSIKKWGINMNNEDVNDIIDSIIVEKYKWFWTREYVASQKDKVFLFGDNTNDRVNTKYIPSSTQAVIRWLPNAIGIDTKKDRWIWFSSYFTNADFNIFKEQVDEAISKAKASWKTIIIPADWIGTGKAKLEERAPKLFEYLNDSLDNLYNNNEIKKIEYKWDTNSIISSIQQSLIQQAKDIKTDLPNNCQ